MPSDVTVVLLRQLVQRTENDHSIWDGLPFEQKIAVAAVLWPGCEYLRSVGADTERGLSALMDSVRPHLSDETVKAVFVVRMEDRLARLAELVNSVERHGAQVERIVAPWRGAVRAVLHNDEAYEQLSIDDDLKLAITDLRRTRATWAQFFECWKVPQELKWRILDLFEYYGPGADSTFAYVERAVLNKRGKMQNAMAARLQQVRAELTDTPTDLQRGPGSEFAELSRLLDSVAKRLHEEASHVASMTNFFGGLETRGGRNHGRAKVVSGLASIYEELTGTKPTATYNLKTESRDSPFVKFVWNAISAAALPEWVDGLETVGARLLQKRKLTSSD